MIDHPRNTSVFLKDSARVSWHSDALWHVRKKRDQARDETEDWEILRNYASDIKDHTLDHLHHYLNLFEKNLRKNGWVVHWAVNADHHNQIVYDLLSERGINQVVKSKSMLTEECGLNGFLESRDIEIIDTDLGERIVQLAHQPPSHIVLPAIHLKKGEISKLFNCHFKTDPASEDPEYLTGVARSSLRQYLVRARVAISGVNFGIAESGGVVVCTNEGNADMGIHHADLYIAAMGIEKLIPGKDQLPVFLKLLARSATGQAITAYTSHLMKPPPGKEYHIILVDNGRTDILARKEYREVLKCIRCGACINTCPVYRRSGGFSYGYSIQGPIGSVLAPLKQMEKYFTLPYASSLCGSCTDVCPVKISLHELLFRLRADAIKSRSFPRSRKWMLAVMDNILFHSFLYRWIGWMVSILIKYLPHDLIYNRFNAWGKARDLPEIPDMSFREWYKKEHLDD